MLTSHTSLFLFHNSSIFPISPLLSFLFPHFSLRSRLPYFLPSSPLLLYSLCSFFQFFSFQFFSFIFFFLCLSTRSPRRASALSLFYILSLHASAYVFPLSSFSSPCLTLSSPVCFCSSDSPLYPYPLPNCHFLLLCSIPFKNLLPFHSDFSTPSLTLSLSPPLSPSSTLSVATPLEPF